MLQTSAETARLVAQQAAQQAAIDKIGEVSHAVLTPAEYAALSDAQRALVGQIQQHAGWYPVVLHHHRDILAAHHGDGQEISVEDTPDWEKLLDDISLSNATGKKLLACAQCQKRYMSGGLEVLDAATHIVQFCSEACLVAFYQAKASA